MVIPHGPQGVHGSELQVQARYRDAGSLATSAKSLSRGARKDDSAIPSRYFWELLSSVFLVVEPSKILSFLI